MELFREGRDTVTRALILKNDPGFLVHRHGGREPEGQGETGVELLRSSRLVKTRPCVAQGGTGDEHGGGTVYMTS